MTQKTFLKDFLKFIYSSPTPFHAVSNMEKILRAKGYTSLEESGNWKLKKGEKYYVIKNDRSIVAFTYNNPTDGFRMIGAHTDSPCLKVKPNPDKEFKNYGQLGVEVYGGVLLNPWFDRDLSLAGKVSYLDNLGKIKSKLLNFQRPVATVPSLAIHLDKNANENRTINKQKDIPPLIGQFKKGITFKDLLLKELKKQKKAAGIKKILDYEMLFYDTQEPSLIGLNEEFLTSARLDNLLSCYVGLMGLIGSSKKYNALLVCSDHEEVGSESNVGAGGPFLKHILERIYGSDFSKMMAKSFMISADNAHGIHPNYSDKHDDSHGPIINNGPVIKINANQRYATDSETSAIFAHLCDKAKVPYQKFVVRSDMRCGSTIGPITSTLIGVKTIDIGVPQFAMHSIREMAGTDDVWYLYKAFLQFFKETKAI
ncbi:MAG: M18 family aminopeptidase [Epsilonproteobacteria bacterium]|nr:MAG: M18 family aminopeptidase [Campylobacterota bacterium]RLA68094.1 MAG: M18 family aminopeptidase [Campylobacterota bacterium]